MVQLDFPTTSLPAFVYNETDLLANYTEIMATMLPIAYPDLNKTSLTELAQNVLALESKIADAYTAAAEYIVTFTDEYNPVSFDEVRSTVFVMHDRH